MFSPRLCGENFFMFQEVSTELLSAGYSVRFRPGGQSMHPTIRDGERITVEPILAEQVRTGDIILYAAARGPVAHRVVRVERREAQSALFHLRGDCAATPDAPVVAAQILGRVVSVEREGRVIALTGPRARLRRVARRALASLKVLGRTVLQRRPRFPLGI
jgi:signal peptidase I